MENRLQVRLLPGWSDHSEENPDGPPTYLRDVSFSPGPLQVSWAWYESGATPDPTDDDLIALSKGIQKSFESPELIETGSGACSVGRYGSAVFRCEEAGRVQAWHLSNGRDLLTVTHIAGNDVDPVEVKEAQQIVEMLAIGRAEDQTPQRSGAAGILSHVLKWFGRGPSR
jgi:hypothetical protein